MWRVKLELPGLRMNLGMNVGLTAVPRPRRLGDRIFHRGDHDATVDGFFSRYCVRDLQQFEFIGADSGHHLVSFDGINVAAPQSFCGQAMFLGVLRLF